MFTNFVWKLFFYRYYLFVLNLFDCMYIVDCLDFFLNFCGFFLEKLLQLLYTLNEKNKNNAAKNIPTNRV